MNRERRAELLDRVEHATELPMLGLAVVFLVIIAIPELTQLSASTQYILDGVSWIVWAAFAFELFVKTYLAPNRRRYLVTHWPDVLIVVLPFLRPLRLLRVVVVASRFWRQIRLVLRNRTFSLIGTSSVLAVGVGATLVYIAERNGDGPIQNYADALWWAMTTITTVGYGDMYPTTPAGRGIAVFLMLAGISLFGLLTARVAAFFVETEESESAAPKLDEILVRLERIEAQLNQLSEDSKVGPPAES